MVLAHRRLALSDCLASRKCKKANDGAARGMGPFRSSNEQCGDKEDALMLMAVRLSKPRSLATGSRRCHCAMRLARPMLLACAMFAAILAPPPLAAEAPVVSSAIGLAAGDLTDQYDSGWAISTPELSLPIDSGQPSLLDSSRVPVSQLLSPGSLDKLLAPKVAAPENAKRDSSGKWRPRSTASKPNAWRKPDANRSPKVRGLIPPADPATDSNKPANPAGNAGAAKVQSSAKVSDNTVREPAPFPGISKAPSAKTPSNDANSRTSIAKDNAADGSNESTEPRIAAKVKRPTELRRGKEIEIPTPDATPSEPKQSTDQPSRKGKRPTPQAADVAAAKPAGPSTKDSAASTDAAAAKQSGKVASKPVEQSEESDKPKAAGPKSMAPLRSAITAAPAADAVKPLTRNQQMLRRRLRSVLSYYYRRPLNSRDHDPWELMHGMLAYGLHSRVLDGGPRGKPVTAVGHLCFNKACKRKRLMHLTPDGLLDAEVAYGLQGHKGQLLAMLAQCNVSPQYPIRVGGKKFTIEDLIAAEQRTCYAGTELTFKLIALMHYTDSDSKWVNDQGEGWDIPRLIHEERNQKIRGAACGGTHRLSGLALAARTRVLRGEPLDGEYLEAQRFVDERINYAFRLQNRDGSLSTEWFRGPGAEEDINRRVRTTGHLLEWLLYSLPDERMTDYRTVRAVNYLVNLLTRNTDNPWEVGPLSHALHALALYDQRVFQPHDNPPQLAKNEKRQTEGTNSRSRQRQTTQQAMNYQNINSRFYGSYPSSEQIDAAREREESGGGLRALFGLGRAGGRRSR